MNKATRTLLSPFVFVIYWIVYTSVFISMLAYATGRAIFGRKQR